MKDWIAKLCAVLLASVTATVGCSSEEEGEEEGTDPGASGGAANAAGLSGSGGQPGTGGQPPAGGTAGQSATGGEPATGGQPPAGGTAGQSATGGEPATGAAAGASGSPGAGGTAGATPSAGCGQTGAATGVQELSIQVGSDTRTYVLSVPDGYDPLSPMPLVFAWHGLGGSGSLARMYFRIEQEANGQAIFVYPDGLPLANMENQPGWDLEADGIDVALFDALLAALSEQYCIDTSRVFTTGHSYGGFFSNRLGCSRADVLRAIAPVAGGLPWGDAGACSSPVAAWIAHGDNDPVVDFALGEGARDRWAGNNGCDDQTEPTTPSPCVAYQGCDAGLPVHWCVHSDEHNWPTFGAEGIWGFFASF